MLSDSAAGWLVVAFRSHLVPSGLSQKSDMVTKLATTGEPEVSTAPGTREVGDAGARL
jgi:hypothetical protein